MNTWLRDYVLYYQLDPKLLPDTHSGQMDQAYLTLVNWQQSSRSCSSAARFYRMDRSKLYKEDTDRYVRLMAGCCRKLQGIICPTEKVLPGGVPGGGGLRVDFSFFLGGVL